MTISPLERLREAVERAVPPVPVAASLGYVLDSADEGRVVARLPALPEPVLRGPGVLLALADTALSAAIATVLTDQRAVSTLTMHWAGVGELPAPGTALTATGTVAHLTADSGLSTGRVVTGTGALVATLACRCAVLPRPAPDYASPDAGPPAALELAGGPASWRMVGAPGLGNTAGGVQGGVLAAVAAHAIDAVVAGSRPHLAGSAADLDVTFLRPVPADGSEFTAKAEPVRLGNRFSAARAGVRDHHGRLAVTVSAAHWRG